MTNQILDDDFRELKNQRTIFSRLSFYLGITYLIIWFYMLISYPDGVTWNLNRTIDSPLFSIVLFARPIVYCLGLLFMIISLITKEPFTFYKWIGLLIYVVVLIIFIAY